ncbi:MAG: hypothetical protein BWY44_00038 [Candidatus Omnitrophica bacterium ADurb.Bin292]|nr:MAG: hypothetical protein BWY44_00038 [Candidatus Omnitrophica bacterium ADurb.Bin292]
MLLAISTSPVIVTQGVSRVITGLNELIKPFSIWSCFSPGWSLFGSSRAQASSKATISSPVSVVARSFSPNSALTELLTSSLPSASSVSEGFTGSPVAKLFSTRTRKESPPSASSERAPMAVFASPESSVQGSTLLMASDHKLSRSAGKSAWHLLKNKLYASAVPGSFKTLERGVSSLTFSLIQPTIFSRISSRLAFNSSDNSPSRRRMFAVSNKIRPESSFAGLCPVLPNA